MKVEVIENKESNQEWKYPCLVIDANNSMIVMATGDCGDGNSGPIFSGFLITNENFSTAWTTDNARFSNSWRKIRFKPFNGKLTLSN